MISAGEFRKGITFEMDGQPYLIVDFQHVKPGKGAAFVRTKYRNLVTGVLREETFNPNDKYPPAPIEQKKWNIYTMMVKCTISWIVKHMIKFL